MSRQRLPDIPTAPLADLARQLGEYAGTPIGLSGTPSTALPQHVIDAVLRGTKHSSYSPPAGIASLREEIAGSLAPEGIVVSAEQVVVTAGAMQALSLSLLLFGGRNREVAMPRPGFFIDGIVEGHGGTIREIDCDPHSGFRPRWASLTTEATDSLSCLYVNSPVNPTGYVFDDQDHEDIRKIVLEQNLWLIIDEAHTNFVYSGRHHKSVWHPDVADRTVVIRSFSKDYAMAGWRVGYAVAPRPIAQLLTSLLERQTVATSVLSQYAALAALQGPKEWQLELAQHAERRGFELAAAVNALDGFHCDAPGGGLAIFPRCSGDSQIIARTLTTKLGIPALAGEAFGTPGFVRLQFGGEPDATAATISRLRGFNWAALSTRG